MNATWPPLPYENFSPTKRTLHRFAQMVGKVRMALVPPRNHWWHTTLYVSTRGLTTGPMPAGDRWAEVEFDFVAHRLRVHTSDGGEGGFALVDRLACADFHDQLFATLGELGVAVEIHAQPFDLPDSTPFAQDHEHDAYDADAVQRYWRILSASRRVLDALASEFAGKQSPAHLFWHGFDLAQSRYSGRRAPAVEGADAVTAEAYSHEVIAFGFWPGDDRTTPFPAFYSYTAPEPDGLREEPLDGGAWQEAGSGSLAVLPYDEVRAADDPSAALAAFFRSAYRAGAARAGWPSGLER